MNELFRGVLFILIVVHLGLLGALIIGSVVYGSLPTLQQIGELEIIVLASIAFSGVVFIIVRKIFG